MQIVGERGFKKTLVVAAFLLPNLLGFLTFLVLPVLASLVVSLTEWNLLSPAKFIGLRNYWSLLGDRDFWAAFGHTLYFIAGYVPLVMVSALIVALALNRHLPLRLFFRTAYFLPVVSSWVAVSLIWRWLLNPAYGLVNFLLSLIGIQGPAWLLDPAWAMPAVILTSVWKDIGFVMVLLLAGLQGIPREYYEAAELDGARGGQQLRHITLPLLSPTTFFVLVILLINSFQVFDQVWVMTRGGPVGATTTVVERIVHYAFRYSQMGYASAMSWVLFAIVFGVTALQLRLQRQWVTYD